MVCISAPVIAAGVGAAGSVASGVMGASASKSAASAQEAAALNAQQIQMNMYNTTRSDLAPYRQVGADAQYAYEGLLGIGTPGASGASGMQAALEQTPGYQFQMQQGLQALQSQYSAQGLGLSGAQIKGAQNYAQGLASSNYQTILGDYSNAMTMGENASAQTSQAGTTAATGAANAATQYGAASASGTVGATNAITGAVNSATSSASNAILMPYMLNAMKSGGLYGGS